MASPREHASPRPLHQQSAAAEAVWRTLGPLLAALVVLAGALPGLVALPPLDRDEARFAQASAQMLESGDPVDIRFQDEPRDKKPVGVYWLQALAVRTVSSVERREIWAYRLPSLLGAMAAAAGTVWAAQALFEPRRALLAGAIFACGWLLQTEAGVAKTDAALAGACSLVLAGLLHAYVRRRAGERPRRRERAAIWIGLAAGLLIKGPVAPLVFALTLLSLAAADRRVDWWGALSWRWGLLFVALAVGPWAAAVTVSSDGGFWWRAAAGDVVPKLVGAHQRHGGWPGTYLLLSPLLIFPTACLAPAALSWGWRRRASPGPRLALCWLVPAWLLFEALPTKLPNYVLPMLPALALLSAGALGEPIGRASRWAGAGLSILAGAAVAAAALAIGQRFGGLAAGAALAAVGVAAGLAGAVGVGFETPPAWTRLDLRAAGLITAAALGVLGHALLVGVFLPALQPLWVSSAAARLIARANLDPRNGLTPGPAAAAGYAEPSLVFLLGTDLELVDGAQAALALEAGRPVLVERRQAAPFLDRLARDHVAARREGSVGGFDYSDGRAVDLGLWRLVSAPGQPGGGGTAAAPPTPP